MKILSRKEALEKSETYYFTGNACKNGHISKRRTQNSTCFDCAKEGSNSWRKNNPEKYRTRLNKWEKENLTERREKQKEYREKHSEKHAKYQRDFRKNNPEKYEATHARWQLANKEKMTPFKAAAKAKRRASELNATPHWLTEEQLQEIKNIYYRAWCYGQITEWTFHVDHIVPLQGENVCGLHHPDNLQILEARVNLQKSNKF